VGRVKNLSRRTEPRGSRALSVFIGSMIADVAGGDGFR